MSNRIIFSPRLSWKTVEGSSFKICYTGSPNIAKTLSTALTNNNFDVQNIKREAASSQGHFAIIASSPSACCAITDHCRSSPIFFTDTMVSNDAHVLRTKAKINVPDPQGIRDASMAGYVTEGRTLFKGLNQLEAGSLAFWHKDSKKPQLARHTVYQPTSFTRASTQSLADDFLSILDKTIQRIVKSADGRPIWVPLSGGLDSRLLLAKLTEHRCKNLFAFTYGPKANDEAKVARLIAGKLGVKWKFFPTTRQEMRRFFSTDERRSFWAFSDGLCSLPTFQDFTTLRQLELKGQLPKNALLINGQTGDFISGGHIPPELMRSSIKTEALLALIVRKHFSLWSSLKTPERLDELYCNLSARLGVQLKATLQKDEAVAYYERFEYEERQAKYVINGQRNYEYLNRRWELPLWDRDIVSFWREIPADLKYNQALYKHALQRWNFRDIFGNTKGEISHWPGSLKAILLPSRLIRISFGRPARDAFLKRMLYFGMYRDQYSPFSYRHFLSNAGDLRSPISLLTKTWLSELGLSGPTSQ